MFTINDDLSIHATRGDVVVFSVSAEDNGAKYKFKPGDIIRMKVFEKKNCLCVVLKKDFPVAEECDEVNVFLTGEDTEIGEIISKPTTYWYEVELNPDTFPQTIIGYDANGAKEFVLYPEGGE